MTLVNQEKSRDLCPGYSFAYTCTRTAMLVARGAENWDGQAYRVNGRNGTAAGTVELLLHCTQMDCNSGDHSYEGTRVLLPKYRHEQ